jgi:hypothetical protein
MAIDYTLIDKLITDYTITLIAGQERYVQFSGVSALSVIAVQILDVGGNIQIQSTLDSLLFLQEYGTVHSDIQWENIKIDGTYYPSVNFNILSLVFNSPNFLYFKNTSPSGQRIKISLRGNR